MEKDLSSNQPVEHKDYSAMEPVPQNARNLGFLDMVATWVGANANNGSWYVGGVVAGSAFAGAIFVTVVANPIAYLIMALIGYIGFKVGISTMALTRPSFGIRGSMLPTVFCITQFIGWTAVNTFIAAISVSYICKIWLGMPAFGEPGSVKTMFLGIILMSILNLSAVSLGHKSVRIAERIGVVLILILGVWETVVLLNNIPLNELVSWRPPADQALPIGKAMDAMAAFSLGWVPAIAEFTRYTKNKASSTVAPMIGANLALFWFAFVGIIGAIGTAITTGVYDPNNSDPSTIVSKLGLGAVAFLVIILTSTTANAINLTAAGISITNITKKIKALPALWLVAVSAALLSMVPLAIGSFLNSFILFLDYIGMVFGPVFGIMIVDYYLVRKGNYDTTQLDDSKGKYWFSSGFNMLAIGTWIISVALFLIMKGIPQIGLVTGATYPTIIISGVLYLIFARVFRKNEANAI